jgi:hypothetical protein
MKIETKYNIGDEVWIPRKFWVIRSDPGIFKPQKGIFVVNSGKKYYIVDVGIFGRLEFDKNYCYPTQEECQLKCDRLNGEVK